MWCLNIRGANGSGKSTLAKSLVDNGQVIDFSGKKHAYTITPTVIAIGSYHNKCGGCDSFVKSEVIELLTYAWFSSLNIVFEGILVGDNYDTYLNVMRDLNKRYPRAYGMAYLILPDEVCLNRVYSRNGNKPIKEELIKNKNKGTLKHANHHWEQPDAFVFKLDATKSISEVKSQLEYGLSNLDSNPTFKCNFSKI